MIKANNPWLELVADSKKRVNSNKYIEFNWFKDENDRYCFGIILNNEIEDKTIRISMKYIDMYKSNFDGKGNIQVFLLDKTNWEIFKHICDDLIEYLEKQDNIDTYEILIEQRLLSWKKLFEKESDLFSLKKQMGLISELSFLKELSLEWSIEKAIDSWCGANGDNQDFAIGNRIYEIKSYILTKGELINISSSKQLDILPSELYLITIGLQNDETGLTIQDMIKTIDKLIGTNSELKTNFHRKLCEYGYFAELLGRQKLYKFAFKTKAAYLVGEKFPRVLSKDIDDRIVEFKYKIDMSKCHKFKLDFYKAIRKDKCSDNNK